MPNAKKVNGIVIHCSAGFGNIESIKKFWKDVLGWKTGGYHIIIDLDGNINQLVPFDAVTNGVANHNSDRIHICYIGGVENVGKDRNGQIVWKGKDTRNDSQRLALHRAINKAINWLKENGKDVENNFEVNGHYDFSTDQNKDGVIQSWERIKECPSFNASMEYDPYTSKDRKGKLPTIKTAATKKDNFIVYVVQPGDTLSKISKNYNTTVNVIKKNNGLLSDLITVKQKLKV